jgi:hypothetical protein
VKYRCLKSNPGQPGRSQPLSDPASHNHFHQMRLSNLFLFGRSRVQISSRRPASLNIFVFFLVGSRSGVGKLQPVKKFSPVLGFVVV